MYEVPGYVYSLRNVGAVRQFRAVTVVAGGVSEIAAANAAIDGVAQMPAAAGAPEVIRIMKSGITYAIAGGIVLAGAMVATDNQGRFVTTAVPADAVGKALTAAGAAGEEIAVLLN
jgi:hypothetical protein